jgi:membrane protease YdiL (CAAX protease family)
MVHCPAQKRLFTGFRAQTERGSSKMKNQYLRRLLGVAEYAFLALLIIAVTQGIWGGLLNLNLALSPDVPWSVAVMALVLWLIGQYLHGRGAPRSTSQTRRTSLRANPVSGRMFAWTLLAGALSIAALTGYWIVMFQLFKLPGNVLPDISRIPLFTLVCIAIMASLVSPLCEEAAVRGYFQVHLEREFRAPVALVISSVLFALIHFTQGFVLPKLAVYFLAGVVFGLIAFLTNSILASIPVHILGDLTFFTLVWPYDTTRHLIWNGGPDIWFWIHVSQALLFTLLAILAFQQLAKTAQQTAPLRKESDEYAR